MGKFTDIEGVQYISADFSSALFAGRTFRVGETVGHQDKESGLAVIEGFSIDEPNADIKVHTSKGVATLPFLEKL